MSEPLLSVCLITYNHVKYIRQAIEGILMQQVDFPWEVIIADDCSTDGTREIVLEYKERYPDLIKLILRKNNVGAGRNWVDLMMTPRSKYIAYIEGDDYWTDPKKLQKQVDILEKDPKYAMSSHGVEIIFDGVEKVDNCYGEPIIDATFEQILNSRMFIASNSIVYRREYLAVMPDWVHTMSGGGHRVLILLLTAKGYNHYFCETMGVKRKNPGGITYVQRRFRDKNRIKYQIYLFENLKKELKGSKDRILDHKLLKLYAKQFVRDFTTFHFASAMHNLYKSVRAFFSHQTCLNIESV